MFFGMFLVCFWWYGGKCFNKGANKQSALKKKNRNKINMIIVMCNRNMINMIIYPHSEQTYSIGLKHQGLEYGEMLTMHLLGLKLGF